MDRDVTRRNRRTLVILAVLPVAMVGLAYASVPLYDLFCRVTGFAGTPGVAEAPSRIVAEREMTVRFDSSVNPALPWRFAPAQPPMTVRVGETAMAFYRAENTGDRATVGTATFNVTPLKAAQYVDKIDCFCFTEQRLAAGESADMGVSFYVDPAIMEDSNLDEVKTITLSYTFFPKYGTDGGAEADGDDAPRQAAQWREGGN
ncbi:MAG TPA: cytochrome c oxidase assembly protein [Alphaproteobacteria bacterium]|nr:cytochrome c oxidase assembly protein [Alphaproteobacteria bacterium]